MKKKINHLPSLAKFFHLQVAPAELEAILLTHPSIEDAAVVP
jgi:4-coumarate--CoA ligase